MLKLYFIALVVFAILLTFFIDFFKISRSANFAKKSWEDDTLFANFAKKTLIRNKNHGAMKVILLDESQGKRRFEFLPHFIKGHGGIRNLNAICKTGLTVSVQDKLLTLIELHRTGEEKELIEESIQEFLLNTDLQSLTDYFAKNKQEYIYLSKIKGKQVKLLREKSLEERSLKAIQLRNHEIDVLERSVFHENLRFNKGAVLRGHCDTAPVSKLLSYDSSINKLTFSSKQIDLFMELLAVRSNEYPICRPAFVSMLTYLFEYLFKLPAIRSVSSCLEAVDKHAQKYLEPGMLVSVTNNLKKTDLILLSRMEQKFKIQLSSLRVSVEV